MILELHIYGNLYDTQYTPFNSELIIYLDVQDKTIKLLVESMEENPYKLGRRRNILNSTLRTANLKQTKKFDK